MIVENATVISYQNGVALVQCYAKSACGGCAAQASCGTKALSGLAGEKFAPRFEIAVSQPLVAGEQIQLGLPENTLLSSVFWLYCVPLMALVLSAVGFSLIFTNELWVASGIFVCTGLAFLGVKKWVARKQQAHFSPIFLGKAK